MAACEIVRRDILLGDYRQSERETGLSRRDMASLPLTDARTGEPLNLWEADEHYDASEFEQRLILPDRVEAVARDLFAQLAAGDGPEQKTIVFCASDDHADRVAAWLNNLYADWCRAEGRTPAEPYAFKCTASVQGGDFVPDFRGLSRRFFVATTVDLLTTGVDVPAVRNIVFFKYVKSPIAFYQMVGRGTRLDPPSGKLMFRVYDYTNATRLFGRDFVSKWRAPRGLGGDGPAPPPPPPKVVATGVEVQVSPAGLFVVTTVDGRAMPVTVEEYRERLAERLVVEARTLDEFRERWITPAERLALLQRMPDGGRAPDVVQAVAEMEPYDLYDVLAELAYGSLALTRPNRSAAFGYKHAEWLRGLPGAASATLMALASQFAADGTDGLENPQIFNVPEVVRAGGLEALKVVGEPAEVLRETKKRLFAA